MKISPVGAQLFHADGQTGMTTLIVILRNFAEAPANAFLTSQRTYEVSIT